MVRSKVCVSPERSQESLIETIQDYARRIEPIGQIGHMGHIRYQVYLSICPFVVFVLFVLSVLFATKFSTDSEEIYVEINTDDFTKLLQRHIYNILHT